MKARKFSLVLFGFITFSLLLTGCYRDQIRLDEKRANQHLISIEQAKAYQQRFLDARKETERFLTDSAIQKKKLVFANAETFNRDIIALLLNQKGADSIRIYFGANEKGEVKLVLLPVDKDGHDIVTTLSANFIALKVPGISSANAGTGGQAGETGTGCPPCTIP